MRLRILLAVLLLMPWGSAAAQVVRGRVLDTQGDLPVPLAEAILVTEAGEEVAKAIGNVNGRFHLSAPSPGSYFLYAEGLAYFSSVEGPLWLSEGDTLDVEFRLQASPFAMDSIRIEVEPQTHQMKMVGFYERKALGLGTFIEREEIVERDPWRITDLFRTVPGIRVVPMGGALGRNVLASGRMSSFATGLLCLPTLFIDGVPSDPGEIDMLVDPFEVEGIEFYSGGAQVPAQYGGSASACGVVSIWTR